MGNIKLKTVTRTELLKLINVFEAEPISSYAFNLNNLDVSKITDFSFVFQHTKQQYEIDKWDVSSATTMYRAFYNSVVSCPLHSWNFSSTICFIEALSYSKEYIAYSANESLETDEVPSYIDCSTLMRNIGYLRKELQY